MAASVSINPSLGNLKSGVADTTTDTTTSPRFAAKGGETSRNTKVAIKACAARVSDLFRSDFSKGINGLKRPGSFLERE
jgi:hypothetical protein